MDDHRRKPPVDFLPACDESQGCDRIPWAASVLPIAVRARRILSRLQAESGTRVKLDLLSLLCSGRMGPEALVRLGDVRSESGAPVPLSSARFGRIDRSHLGFNRLPVSSDTEAVWGVREEFHSVVGSWIFAPIIG